MSELKAYNSERIYWAVEQAEQEAGDIDNLHLDDNLFYPKSEADKMIAELKEKLDLYKRGWGENDKVNAYLYAELRHNKFKRCLTMAKWCRMHDEFTQLESERLGLPQRTLFLEYRRKAMWWNKWRKRWLQLARKLKEAK